MYRIMYHRFYFNTFYICIFLGVAIIYLWVCLPWSISKWLQAAQLQRPRGSRVPGSGVQRVSVAHGVPVPRWGGFFQRPRGRGGKRIVQIFSGVSTGRKQNVWWFLDGGSLLPQYNKRYPCVSTNQPQTYSPCSLVEDCSCILTAKLGKSTSNGTSYQMGTTWVPKWVPGFWTPTWGWFG